MERRRFLAAGIIIMILAIVFAFGLASCTGSGDTGGDDDPYVYELAESGESYMITGVTKTDMKEIIVPGSYNGKAVTEIAAEAFKNCSSATNIVVPASIKSIGKGAFRGCGGVTSISIPFVGQKQGAVAEKSVFGYVFGQNEYAGSAETVQTFGEAEEDNETYYIPYSLREVIFTGEKIPYGGFSNCGEIGSITIGPLVTAIEDKAFLNNNIAYVYVESNYISSALLDLQACGGLIFNVPAVCLGKNVNRVSGYVAGMDTKGGWTHNDKQYDIYANKKFYRFEAEKSDFAGGLSSAESAMGANGIPTGGGAYLTGFYPNGGTGQCYMEYRITSSKDTTAAFIYCCGSRSTHYFNSCYKLTLNGQVIVAENDVNLSLPAGVSFQWTQWTRYQIMEVQLKKGENVFRMQFTPDGKETAESFSNDMYVDYIEFETDAILTWTN